MNLETITKINKAIEPAKQIALIIPEDVTIDQLCSATALQNALQQKGKITQIFTSCKNLPKLEFLQNHL